MHKRSKSRTKIRVKTQPNWFKTGNMLSHPSGDKIFKEQSKILLQKQKQQKNLWMLNKTSQFINTQRQKEEDDCETDIDMDSNQSKRRISRKVIQVKKKKIVVRIPYDRQEDSQSDVTSGQEEQTINHYEKPQVRNNIYQPVPMKKINKPQEKSNFHRPEQRIVNIKKQEPIKKTLNIKQVEKSPMKKVEERKKPINRMQTSQEVLKKWEQEYYAATQRKVARFHDYNYDHQEDIYQW